MLVGKFKSIGGCLLVVLLTGCALELRSVTSTESANNIESADSPKCATPEKPEDQVKLQMIRRMMDGGKLHASLAHLDATRVHSSQETYLRAEILRRIGRTDLAAVLYQQLIQGCAAGDGYHGLGLISGRNGKIKEALDYLGKARDKLPTDVQVRNDMGYALLLDQQYELASHEFMTALELDENNEFSAPNLVLVLLATGQFQKAQVLAQRLKLSDESFNSLRAQAVAMQKSTELKSPELRQPANWSRESDRPGVGGAVANDKKLVNSKYRGQPAVSRPVLSAKSRAARGIARKGRVHCKRSQRT
ncbi:MAG: tetratricopeptide repeat protein, partial [Methylococcales bacterium]